MWLFYSCCQFFCIRKFLEKTSFSGLIYAVRCLMVLTVSITTISAGPIQGCWIYLPFASYPGSDSAWCYTLWHKVKQKPVIFFPHSSLSSPFSWPLQMGSAPCFGMGVTLCKQITCLAFHSASKTQNFKISQLKSCLSPLLTSFQLPQAAIPTYIFAFPLFFPQQPNQMGMVIALHKKPVSGVTEKLKGYSGELFSWI